MPHIHVDEVYPKEGSIPLIVNFQNGYTTEQFKEIPCELYCDQKTDKKVLATELSDLIYSGSEETEELGKSFLLVRNKTTGKVRMIEVGNVELKPIIKNNLDISQLLETSNLELSRKFGSKKQKQQMEQREKLKVNVTTVTEQMQNVTQTISEDTLDISSYIKTDSDDFYIPPIDRSANKAENVYDINQILSEEDYEKVTSEIEDKDYISSMVPVIKNIVTSKNLSQKQIVLAIYADSLLKLYTTMVKDIVIKSFTACKHSATLNGLVLTNFLVTTGERHKRSRPATYKDKSLCYALVLILLINNLKCDLESLLQCVKVSANTFTQKAKVTGASVVTSGNKKILQLKLPLNTKSGFRRRSAKF